MNTTVKESSCIELSRPCVGAAALLEINIALLPLPDQAVARKVPLDPEGQRWITPAQAYTICQSHRKWFHGDNSW